MADSTGRTGSAPWKKLRARVLKQAQEEGLTNCPTPSCRVELDYETGRNPNSAEVDHIVPHSRGGLDIEENCQVLCRRCNQSKGNRVAPRKQVPKLAPFVNTRW